MDLDTKVFSRKYHSSFRDLFTKSNNIWFIHYSCESFTNTKSGLPPKVVCIVVQRYGSSQQKSFCSHFEQVFGGNDERKASEAPGSIDDKEALSDFFCWLKNDTTRHFVHWRMRSSFFGFEALEKRFTIVGGRPHKVLDNQKHDLPEILRNIYGNSFSDNSKMDSVMHMNEISVNDFLSGLEELEALRNNNLNAVFRSTQRKVRTFSFITELAIDKKLKKRAGPEKHLRMQSKVDMIKDHWVFVILSFVLVVLSFFATLLV
ncbi:MAG: hypothetical protein AAFY02_17535 [Pseudomonadota bacterium]